MPDRLSWSVAWRGLVRSKRLTALTLVVLSVSVILVIFLTALIDGLERDLVEETTGAIAHVLIEPREREPLALWNREQPAAPDGGLLYLGERTTLTSQKGAIDNWPRWTRLVDRFGPEIQGVSPAAEGQGFVIRGEKREAVRLYGIEPRRYDRLVPIQKNLVEGRFYELGPGEVAIGYKLAETMGVDTGDRLQVTTSAGTGRSMRIVGLFDTGFGGVDNAAVFMRLGDGQSLFGLGASVNAIGVEVHNVFQADRVAEQLQRQVPHAVTSWIADNERLLRALEGQGRSSDLIIFFTAVAAAFAIASILIVLVTNKLPEIGILKAMGATRRQIRTVFALQGALLSLVGGILGASVGALTVKLLSKIEGPPTASGRTEPLFPFELSPELVAGTVVGAVLIGFVASLVPALRASDVDPIEVIQNG
ncbi:ABC transporter permease [Salinibacter sp.]|uniref:ABC transporter permease n=1 Tax=Salinibacter sp. TaxID=2065818 RepID=UPI0021E8DE04|nr:FtsX-like permease family protein [Salinibacter sp.]